jgi:serine/threonine protein kinase
MSFVPGLTLRSVHRRMMVRRERLSPAAALHIARDVCEALQHVHELEDGSGELGLIHRDLSPTTSSSPAAAPRS